MNNYYSTATWSMMRIPNRNFGFALKILSDLKDTIQNAFFLFALNIYITLFLCNLQFNLSSVCYVLRSRYNLRKIRFNIHNSEN